MKKKKVLKWLLVLYALFVGVVCVKAEDYVKWKRVSDDVLPAGNPVVVIVDLNTGLAMSNDKADKDPDAVAVTLNYDKDRILGEVPENVQWTLTNVENGGFKFAAADGNLYADGGKLKVGSDGTDNGFSKYFTDDNVCYLKINNYLAGVEESMFSNTWKLTELKGDKPDDKVKDTRFAIFEKVVDSKTVPTLAFPHDNYEINSAHDPNMNVRHYVQFESAIATNFTEYANDKIGYYITKETNSVFVPVSSTNYEETIYADKLELYKSGTDKLIARIQETIDHDKAVAVCTIRYNNTWEDANNKKGTKENPLTVEEAIKLAKNELDGYTLEEDRCYFIKGKVNKVNSGMMAMFGDMGLDEMLGDDMDMEEMMGDMDDFDMNEMGDMMGGMDFMSMIPGFGNSDGLTYYISDNGTKDNRIKVTNGRGLVTLEGFSGQTANKIAEFDKLEDLSPGDDVLVYGPLVLSEDKNMFAGLMEGIGGSEGIPGMSGQQSDYEWAPMSLNDLESGDVVLLVDNGKTIALKSDLASSSVTIKNDKIADNNSISGDIQWTLTKNTDGTVTFKKDDTPLSITTQMNLTVGQGNRSDFTYNNGIIGIDYGSSLGVYCIKWDGDNKAVFGQLHNGQYTEADFTFYKKVQKTEEDKRTVKVGELNYLHNIKRALVVPGPDATDQPHMYENTTKSLSDNQGFFYTINSSDLLIPLTGTIQPAQVKSADEEIAKWVYTNEEKTDSVFTAVEKGKTKITVKVKVIVAPAEGDNKEKSYTMKRKFQLEVLPRDKEPEGKNVGEYVLVQNASELKDGTRLLIIGTRTKTDTENNTETKTKYALSANNSMMGGGKGGTKVDDDKFSTSKEDGVAGRECITYENVPEGVQEIILEKQTDGSWYLNVGKDENGNPVYLYASVKAKEEGETNTEGSGNGGGFNMDEMMEMFNPSSGLKVGTVDGTRSSVEGVDSLKATISISNDIATITFPAIDADKNTIVLASSFDMESMMNMFSSEGQGEGQGEGEGQEQGGNSSSFNMGSFDMFMASFNTKKPEDIDGKKAFLPRIFGFVQYDEYPVTIGDAEWKTIVSDYDVTPDSKVEAYIVTEVTEGQNDENSKAKLAPVQELRGGEPYLLHSEAGTFTMTRITLDETANDGHMVDAPTDNLLEVSSETTTGGENSTIYVLAKVDKVFGFLRWTGGLLGAGRVYLPVDPSSGIREFVSFDTSDASGIVSTELKTMTEGQYYMLDGRLVETPTKGLYIVNGKKVVIK